MSIPIQKSIPPQQTTIHHERLRAALAPPAGQTWETDQAWETDAEAPETGAQGQETANWQDRATDREVNPFGAIVAMCGLTALVLCAYAPFSPARTVAGCGLSLVIIGIGWAWAAVGRGTVRRSLRPRLPRFDWSWLVAADPYQAEEEAARLAEIRAQRFYAEEVDR